MHVITTFHGILIRMYFFDTDRHQLPQFHADDQGEQAVFAIDSGDRFADELPRGKERLVLAWIELHREELQADWQLAAEGETPFRIEPLR